MAYNVHSLLFVLTNRKPEFKKYFEEGKRTVSSNSGKVRYETSPGEQAQLDLKRQASNLKQNDGEMRLCKVCG